MANKNTAHRLMVLLSILDDEIEDKNLIGISMWSSEALDCMIHIEVDNGLISYLQVKYHD